MTSEKIFQKIKRMEKDQRRGEILDDVHAVS